MKAIIALAAAAGMFACANGAHGEEKEGCSLEITGVAVVENIHAHERREFRFLPPDSRIVVPSEKQVAAFRVDYSIPTNSNARIWLRPRDGGIGDAFGSSPSGLYSGNGSVTRFLFLDDESAGDGVSLDAVNLSVTIEDSNGRRLKELQWDDVPVHVMYAGGKNMDKSDTKAAEPPPKPEGSTAQSVGRSTPAGFTDNLDEAFEKAKAEDKLLYVCFSGSDWCGWCKRLRKEVFDHDSFIKAVSNAYVLVYIDLPHDKSLLSERAKEENQRLAKKYKIQGVPMALILDGDGNKLGGIGYSKGGAKKYVKLLMDFHKELKSGAAPAGKQQ